MASKINGIPYADNVSDILSDTTLKKAFLAFAKRTAVDENTSFLLAADGRIDPKLLYGSFFSSSGNMSINIPGTLRDKADALARQNPPDWSANSWARVIQEARGEIVALLNQHSLALFWKSREFLDIHEPAVRRQIKGLDKAASVLGIKNKNLLEELLFRIRLNGPDSTEAKTASDKLITAEKLAMKRDALLKALKSAGFLAA
ncbi:MAG: hypothetical protein KF788_02365 [Piscinibacter sp.]|nr:hypothetical protein [Piscinibacter sp.]